MSWWMIDVALKSLPRDARERDAEAIRSVAAEQVEAGEVSGPRQVTGIVQQGMRMRVGASGRALRGAPWSAALWRLAAPVAAVQLALMFAASGLLENGASLSWPGRWFAVVLVLSAIVFAAAAMQERRVLGAASGLLLLLFCVDTWGPGGSMRGAVSHAPDVIFHSAYGYSLAPIVLVLIPTLLLLVAAACSRPPAEVRRTGVSFLWGILLAVGVVVAEAAASAEHPLISGSLVMLLGIGGTAALVVEGKLRKGQVSLFSAVLLLLSQSLLLGTSLAYYVMDRQEFAMEPWVIWLPVLAFTMLLPFVCAAAMANRWARR